jgi:hypothetical protein
MSEFSNDNINSTQSTDKVTSNDHQSVSNTNLDVFNITNDVPMSAKEKKRQQFMAKQAEQQKKLLEKKQKESIKQQKRKANGQIQDDDDSDDEVYSHPKGLIGTITPSASVNAKKASVSDSDSSDSDSDSSESDSDSSDDDNESKTALSKSNSRNIKSKFLKSSDSDSSDSDSDSEPESNSKSKPNSESRSNSKSNSRPNSKSKSKSKSDSDSSDSDSSDSDSDDEIKRVSKPKVKRVLKMRDRTKTVVHTKTHKAKKSEQILKEGTVAKVPEINTSSTNENNIDVDNLIFDIDVRFQARNSRKKICSFAGIPDKYFSDKGKVDGMLKAIKATIASRATIKKTDSDGNVIEVSGDNIDIIRPIIKKFCGCPDEYFKIHK